MASTNVIRYGVVGLGYIAQAAVLPSFKHAKNSRLTALISGNAKKQELLGKKYRVPNVTDYDHYDTFLKSGVADAVYIALPNSLHAPYAIAAADAGLHVLCEKPMATSEKECRDMIAAAKKNKVKLMIAYRLHFDEANLEAIKLVKNGKLGDVRFFGSLFSRQVKEGDIRLKAGLGGGSVWDLGVYCVNAARYLFRDEPLEVQAFSTGGKYSRFKEVDEMTSVLLRFPADRFATFISSFGASDTGAFEIVGTKGSLRMNPSYEYAEPLAYELTINEKTTRKKFGKHDQFAAELIYFSDCILKNQEPEPSGQEGLNDVKIIRAIYEAAKTGKKISLRDIPEKPSAEPSQKKKLPPVDKPKFINASEMSR